MQISKNNSPSFGMSCKVDVKSFRKVNEADQMLVKKTYDMASKNLEKVSKYVNVSISPKVKKGQMTAVKLMGHPEISTASEGFGMIFKAIKDILTPSSAKKYVKAISIDELNAKTLTDATSEISKAALDRFGSIKKTQDLFESKINK